MAAGLGFKTFTTGEVLTAGDVNGYLMQGINVFASEAARNAAITSPQEGQFAFTKDNNSLWYYSGSAWVASGATGDIEGVTVTSPLTGGGTSGTVTVGILSGTTSNLGAVQLSDSTSSTSTTLAATANAVKTAYDVAVAAVPKSTVTTAGDVIYATGSSTVTRLGIGTAGQVLTVNGGATAPSWSTISSGGMTLIASATPTGVGTYTFSSIAGTYKNLVLLIEGLSSSAGEINMNMRFNGDTGNNYVRSWIRTVSSTVTGQANDPANNIQIGNISCRNTTALTRLQAEITIYDYASAQAVKFTNGTSYGNGYQTSADQPASAVFNGGWSNTGAITSITIYDANGPYNFSNGTLKLYGVS